ncbi:putative motility protein YjfB-like [Tamilnaduibacter salinus]|uniref:Putative motility protein YjfB-like n=1 Tax=Tamilnaduibacter salinus TaxID=1484056 RepID=A0A2U1CUG6_9GAMM|nr:putative motility protein [Tamilnaduibacter salinus]PVY70654.1 putative motility protein YjfB-like [Tamilnaduibacter salinus]
MDTSSLASFATQLNQSQVQQQVQISVLKSAQEMASSGALQLLEGVSQSVPTSPTSANPNVGSQIDVRA